MKAREVVPDEGRERFEGSLTWQAHVAPISVVADERRINELKFALASSPLRKVPPQPSRDSPISLANPRKRGTKYT